MNASMRSTLISSSSSSSSLILIVAARNKKSDQQKASEQVPLRITSNVKQNLQFLKLWREFQKQKSSTPRPATSYRKKKAVKEDFLEDTELYHDPTTLYYTNQDLDTAVPVLLVDGYNVCGYWAKLKKHFMNGRLGNARQKLIDELITFSVLKEVKVVVVFDAMMSGLPNHRETFAGIDIIFSSETCADAWIEKEVVALKEDGCPKVWVVTSDACQQQAAHGAGAFVWSCKALVSEINASQKEFEQILSEHRSTSMQGKLLQHNLGAEVVVALKDLKKKLSESKYECSKCKLDLHGKCAQALGEPSITTDFFRGCEFLFLDSPPARGRYCDVCGLDIRGYHYSCSKMGLDMHPCCEGLPSTIVSGCNVLHLRDKMTSKCIKCGKQRLRSSRKRNTWCYASSCGDYHLHVACLNDMLLSEEEMKGDDSVLARIDPLPPIVPHLLQGDDSAMKGDDTALARIDPRPPIVPERRKKGIVWWVFKLAPSIISAVKGDRRPLYGIGSSILKKWSLNQSAPLAELH